jgi:hypothetical protein
MIENIIIYYFIISYIAGLLFSLIKTVESIRIKIYEDIPYYWGGMILTGYFIGLPFLVYEILFNTIKINN